MQRIVVVGTSGSGKTTVSDRLADVLGVPHIELDSLHWEANWTEADSDVLRRRVVDAMGNGGWVIDGNYSALRDLIWPQADTLVWLDYGIGRVLWQVTTRTARRVVTRQELWSGNREGLRAAFSKESIIWWALTTYRKNRRRYSALIEAPDTGHMTVRRFRSPRQVKGWVTQLATGEA